MPVRKGIGGWTISSARDAEESNVRIRFEVNSKVVLKSYKGYNMAFSSSWLETFLMDDG